MAIKVKQDQRIVTVNRNRYGYEIDGEFLRRVTTHLRGIPKPWLGRWAAKEVATWAVENQDKWLGLEPEDAIGVLKKKPWDKRDEAGDRGTAVHNAIEAYVNDEPLPDGMTEDEFDCAVAAEAFLRGFVGQVLAAELTVYSWTHDYAGTLDLWAVDRDGTRWILDWKGLALDTPISTPNGWSTMGDLSEGDRVFGADGKPCRVVAKSDVHHRPCYRVAFDDGSSIVADNEHLWRVVFADTGETRVLRTDELHEHMHERHGQRRLTIPNPEPLELPPANLPVAPYTFGVWLGDGTVSAGKVTGVDENVFSRVEDDGYEVGAAHGNDTTKAPTKTVYGLQAQLRKFGLLGAKGVPDYYLRASRKQRLALLRGLMDTDGTWNAVRGRAVFETTDDHLADVVNELAVSLGQRTSRWTGEANGFGKTVTRHRVSFRPVGINPFHSPVKASQVGTGVKRDTSARRRMIQSVERVDTVPTQCIAVDSPDSLYLAGENMIPTHNTSKDVYTDHAVQQVAYQRAEHAVVEKTETDDEEWEGTSIEWGPHRAERLGIVHVTPEGASLHEIRPDHTDRLWTVFRAAKHMKAWQKDTDDYRGDPDVPVYEEPVAFSPEDAEAEPATAKA